MHLAMGVGTGSIGRVPKPTGVVNPRIYGQLNKQLGRDWAGSIHRALKTAKCTLVEHVAKLSDMKYHSAVESTINNVSSQIATLERFIKDNGL